MYYLFFALVEGEWSVSHFVRFTFGTVPSWCGRTIAQAVSCRLLTTETRIRSQVMWDWDTVFSESFGFPRQYHSSAASYLLVRHLGDGQRSR
jgi:hypothetical protein